MFTILDLLLKKVDTCSCILLWVVSTLAAILDFSTAPLLRQPSQTRLQWPPPWMVENDSSVNA